MSYVTSSPSSANAGIVKNEFRVPGNFIFGHQYYFQVLGKIKNLRLRYDVAFLNMANQSATNIFAAL